MRQIRSIYYHNPSAEGFAKIIKYLRRHRYRFISLEELYNILIGKININEKLAFVSLDDGWHGNLNLLHIIERYNVPICIFAATQPLKNGNFWWEYVGEMLGDRGVLRYKSMSYSAFCNGLSEVRAKVELTRSALTEDEVSRLAVHPLVTIQSHTVTHPILTHCPDDVLEKELADSKAELERLTNQPVYAFSYPNGSLSEREINAVKRHYSIAFTTAQKNISLSDDIYTLPRYALTGQYYRDLLKVWGVWKYLKAIMRGLNLSN